MNASAVLATSSLTLMLATAQAAVAGTSHITFTAGTVLSSGQAAWPQTYYDGGNTGYNPYETTLSPANVSQLKLRWAQSVPNGSVQALAADYGIVFAQGFLFNGYPMALRAFDAATGKKLWTQVAGINQNNGETTQIAVAQGLVFADCSPAGTVNGVCAYKAQSGEQVWSYGSGTGSGSLLGGPILYTNGVVYFTYCATSLGCPPYSPIVALDAVSGSVVGIYRNLNIKDPRTVPTGLLAVGDGYLYCASAAGVFALNNHGGVAWTYSHGNLATGPNSISFQGGVVYENVVYDGAGDVTALNGRTGAPLWTFSYPLGYQGQLPPAVANGIVYVTAYPAYPGGGLYALDARTGKLLWSNTASPYYITAPSVANGLLYAGHSGNITTAQDLRTGAILFSTMALASPYAGYQTVPPIVANGMLYTTCGASGSVCAYGLPRRPR